MSDQPIKSFLVGLGFQVDEAGRSRFEQTLTGIGMQAVKLEAAVAAAGASIGAFAVRVASHMDQLYFASQRTGATVQGLQAIGYAASQTGSSAQAAQGAVENLAHFMRTNPGAEGWIDRLGVSTRDAHGNMRDTADIFMDLGSRLSQMPYYQANQFAQQFGLDERTLIAMTHNMRQARDQYNGFARDIGYNGQQAAQESHGFMSALRELYAVTGLLSDKIGSDTAGSLTGSVNSLSQVLLQNAPVIEKWAKIGTDEISNIGNAIVIVADNLGKLGPTVTEVSEDIKGLLGVDAKGWTASWNLTDFNNQLGQAVDTLNTLARIVRDVRTGNWGDLPDADRHLWNIGQPKGQDAPLVKIADSINNGLRRTAMRSNNAVVKFGGADSSNLLDSQQHLFNQIEQHYKLPEGLLRSVAMQESSGDPNRVNRKSGAQGEFQFIPSTARSYGLNNPFDPTSSAMTAARMLSDLMKQYHGNLTRALQAYNLGSGNLNSRLANHRPLPLETQRYAPQIIARMPQQPSNTTTNVTVYGSSSPDSTAHAVKNAVADAQSQHSQLAMVGR